MNPLSPLLYEFDEFRVDPERRLLLRKDEQISLTSKVFDLLLVFIEARGETLEKDRLMELLWSDSFVEESNIVQNVAVLRRALGERSGENKFIVTIPGRGYRFVADVRIIKNGGDKLDARPAGERKTAFSPARTALTLVRPFGTGSAAAALAVGERIEPSIGAKTGFDKALDVTNKSPDSGRAGTNRIPLFRIAAIMGLFAIGAIAAYLLFSYSRPSAGAGGTAAKIAVLPPKSVDGENRQRSVEFAIVHSLILKLSESTSFNVSQLSAVRKFVELDVDPITAGRELGVDFVLASDYQFSDGRIRVTSQLLNVSTGDTEQMYKTEAATVNAFSMQDVVANEIGNAVLARFGRPATKFAARRGTQNQDAHNLFYEALYLVDKGSRDDSEKAAELLGQAVILDPVYAEAWALRAQAFCQFGHAGGGVPQEVFTIAEPMLDKALALDQNNATAFMVRGTLNRDYHWRFDEAYRDLQHSIELDPQVGQAHRVLAGLYYRDGRLAQALEEQRKALDINPTSIVDRWFLGLYLVKGGHRDEGVAMLKRVIELDPLFWVSYDTLWQLYHEEGDHANAYAYFLKVKEALGTKPDHLAELKNAHARSGWPGVLQADLRQMTSKDTKGKYSGAKFYIATLAALTGDKDLAFEYLEEALRFRHIGISYLKVEHRLDSLRDDPRFDDLLRRAGLRTGF